LIDTGPLVGLYHDGDPHHARCRATLAGLRPPLLTCWPVLTEAAWLLRKRPDAFQAIIRGFDSAGLFEILPLDGEDLAAIAAIMRRYEDARLQLADAALVHLAEREGIRTVFTLDRRDSSIIRLKRNRPLKIVPEPA
jgi:hypothetical protein